MNRLSDLARAKISRAIQCLSDADARVEADFRDAPAVALFYAVHASTLAFDSICHKVAREPARHHDEPRFILLELVRAGKIPATAARWKDLLTTVARRRNHIFYDVEYVSKEDARRLIRDVSAFVDFASDLVRGA